MGRDQEMNTDLQRWLLLMRRARELRKSGKFESAARMINLARRIRLYGWPPPEPRTHYKGLGWSTIREDS